MAKTPKHNAQYYDIELLERARRVLRQSQKLIEQTRALIAQSAELKGDFRFGPERSRSKPPH